MRSDDDWWAAMASRDSPKTAPSIVQRDFPLARLATIRTGGNADYFARAGSNAQLRELLAWATR